MFSRACLESESQKVRVIRSSGSGITQFGFNFGSIRTSCVTLSKLGLCKGNSTDFIGSLEESIEDCIR